MSGFRDRPLPPALQGLLDFALDIRWNWSHGSDQLWERLDPETFELTSNPHLILGEMSEARLEAAARDPDLIAQLQWELKQRQEYLNDPGWFRRSFPDSLLKSIAYFSMEFGLAESLPIYSGGLGILAGDYLKTASDMGLPVCGIGLLYQQGYFRQILSSDGRQLEAFPYNDPTDLPLTPVRDRDGGRLHIRIDLPGRRMNLRVWRATVGKVPLYLLDSNDPTNSPWDRAITSTLYAPGQERRFLQEVVLGIGGWRVLEELGMDVDICHLNEGHAAFAILARAHSFGRRHNCSMPTAVWATRPGNVFTTHTPVEAAFDRFDPALIEQFAGPIVERMGASMHDLLALGRRDPDNAQEPFNMAYLAIRGSGYVNGVSQLHGQVSRQIFQPLFPEWPAVEVPVNHVTNGVHVPSWDSQLAEKLWTGACGEDRWYGDVDHLCASFCQVTDVDLWNFRAESRRSLIAYVRWRLARQLRQHGASVPQIERANHALDPNALTLGFARRFTAYKRPNLILNDLDRLEKILKNIEHPVQLIVAGKAHPADEEGKHLVQMMAQFAGRESLLDRVIFLEDYDMALSKRLAAGIDVWLNTPRRPWEACGTSGMKVLVNGGINLSELDGWWAEAYSPEVGWALGDGREHPEGRWDMVEADQLYQLLEESIIPEFYRRDETGIPKDWIVRVRTSMSQLTPRFSCNRMMREYLEQAYLPNARAFRRRAADNGLIAAELLEWNDKIHQTWNHVHFGDVRVTSQETQWHFDVMLYLAELDPSQVRVELYAENLQPGGDPIRIEMTCDGEIPGTLNGHRYFAEAPGNRPASHFTPRVMPYHPDVLQPLELSLIRWRR
ncbi:MAG: alpha-glucan family phosphorylase [Planctomycetes bacterium]|nr:alpha-glucan family phosphorylase [Planctomycetota bacterium]